jgi:outer membrane protein TolC
MTRRLATLLPLLALGSASLAAQGGAAPADSLRLPEVLAATLARNVDLLVARRQLEVDRGGALAAGTPFDLRVATYVGGDRTNSPSTVPGTGTTLTTSASYGLSATKQFRFGVQVRPTLQVSRSTITPASPIAVSSAEARLDLTVPLLRDRGGAMSRAEERAADQTYQGSVLSARQTAAASALDAASRFWEYLAAGRRLAVYASSEARAQRLADRTAALVQADERPRSDLPQLLANVTTKRAIRLSAEQAVIEAREQMGLVMGLEPDRILALPGAAGEFPAVDTAATDSIDGSALVSQALAQRADLAALERGRSAAESRLRGAASGLRPRLDLTIGAGYIGLDQGSGVSRLFTPLFRNVPGYNATVRLDYDLYSQNSDLRGGAQQAEAILAQQRLQELDLRRRITTGVLVAVEALRHRRQQLAKAAEAVALSEQTVGNERRKFMLGSVTLFDVIQAEDGLTNAELARLDAQLGYALALAAIRYQTGTLVEFDRSDARVPPDRLLTAP